MIFVVIIMMEFKTKPSKEEEEVCTVHEVDVRSLVH